MIRLIGSAARVVIVVKGSIFDEGQRRIRALKLAIDDAAGTRN